MVKEIKLEGVWDDLESKKNVSTDSLLNCLLIFMSLLTTPIVKNSYI